MTQSVRPFGRPTPHCRAAAMRTVDQIGLFLVCPRRACRRQRRCADREAGQLPFCLWQHRGTVRFLLAAAAARQGIEPAAAREETEERPPPPLETARPLVPARLTVLGALEAAGVPVRALARRRDEGADDWSWERHPAFVAAVARAGSPGPEDAAGGAADPPP